MMADSQWKGKVTANLPKTNADQIWPFFLDFVGIYKYFQTLSTSYGVSGNNGEVGSIRYCNGSSIPSQNSTNTSEKKPMSSWSKERLIAIDSKEKTLSYEIVDSNLGFNNYVSTIKIVSRNRVNGQEETGCFIEWSFRVDPVEGLVLQDLLNKYETGIHRMARKMTEALAACDA